jgi:hypothetical protein
MNKATIFGGAVLATLAIAGCGTKPPSAASSAPVTPSATTAPTSAAATTPAANASPSVSCSSLSEAWYLQPGANDIAEVEGAWTAVTNEEDTTLATQHSAAANLWSVTLYNGDGMWYGQPQIPACNTIAVQAMKTAMADLHQAAVLERASQSLALIPAAVQDATAGFAALTTVANSR